MEFLKDLNEKQKLAVTTPNKKVLVIAGAGSGKTKVLTSRIAYLLESGVPKDKIKAFTFTKRAAMEMKYRLKKYDFDNIFTFHSYCYQLLNECKYELGFNDKKIHVIDDDFSYKLIDMILSKMNLNFNQRMIKDYISKRKNGINSPINDLEKERLYNQLFYNYQEYLMNKGFIDFDDMISLIVNNFDNLLIKDFILDECEYILVDECQDTNKIQFDLITKLSSKYNNIFMVGDINQLIYSFRSSDIKIINDFKETADEVIILNQNYRCSQNILSYANKLIKNNKAKIDYDIFSNIPTKFEIKIEDYQNIEQEAKISAYKIKKLIELGYKPNEIAVLYRNNNQSIMIESELKKLNIPYTQYGKLKFYDNDLIKRIIAIYKFIDTPDLILFRIIKPIDQIVYEKLVNNYNSDKDLIMYLISYPNDNINDTKNNLKDLIDNKNNLDKKSKFEAILNILTTESTNESDLVYAREFKDIILNSELEEYELFNELMLDPTIYNKNEMGVNLLTIHKAKGLEFKCVFIISINDKILPNNKIDNNKLEEERRLLYVAMTRAKDYLSLSSAEYHISDGIKKRLKPSLFLSELKT